MKTHELSQEDIIKKIQMIVEECGTRQKAALRLGVSIQFLNDVLKGTRAPGETVPQRLGYRKKISYVPIDAAA